MVDTDGDGKVSFDEFLAFCQRFQLDRVEPTDCLESRDRDSNVLFQEEEKTLHPSQKVWNGRSPENSGLVGQNIKYFEYQVGDFPSLLDLLMDITLRLSVTHDG